MMHAGVAQSTERMPLWLPCIIQFNSLCSVSGLDWTPLSNAMQNKRRTAQKNKFIMRAMFPLSPFAVHLACSEVFASSALARFGRSFKSWIT